MQELCGWANSSHMDALHLNNPNVQKYGLCKLGLQTSSGFEDYEYCGERSVLLAEKTNNCHLHTDYSATKF
jgi:hypothetical protein